jgi:hypothetical protein
MGLIMARKGSMGVLETLQKGPEHPYGSASDHENECVKQAKEWIVGAGPIEYRKQLLDALLAFERRNILNEAAMDAAGESS